MTTQRYNIHFTVSIQDQKDGWTRLGFTWDRDLEVARMADLTELLMKMEAFCEEWAARFAESSSSTSSPTSSTTSPAPPGSAPSPPAADDAGSPG